MHLQYSGAYWLLASFLANDWTTLSGWNDEEEQEEQEKEQEQEEQEWL